MFKNQKIMNKYFGAMAIGSLMVISVPAFSQADHMTNGVVRKIDLENATKKAEEAMASARQESVQRVAEAEKRDPKGLYKKARAGLIKNFTGISDPYEAPEGAELVLHTAEMTLEQEVASVLALLAQTIKNDPDTYMSHQIKLN